MVRQPLAATETMDKFDLLILADGGGVAGQAGAARLGISRALVEFNAELRSRLKKLGFLTRDPRQHERKKYGQKGAASGSSSPNVKVLVRPGGQLRSAFRRLAICSIPTSALVRARKSRFGPRGG